MGFPRSHLVLLGVLLLLMCTFVVAKFNSNDNVQRFSSDEVLAELSADPLLENTQPDSVTIAATIPLEASVPAEPTPPLWRQVQATVKPGDNLAILFKRQGLSAREVYRVTQAEPFGERLRNIFPGHELTFHFDPAADAEAANEQPRLMALHYTTGPLHTLVYEREGETFNSRQEVREPETVVASKHGSIEHSLFVASQRAGLSDSLTMRLAQIFQWDIDFVLDIRPGDSFYVLYEEQYLNDEFIGHGDILAAEFINQGEAFRAMRYSDTSGDEDYFSPDGNSMRKAFLRAPVEFSRISSNFNLRRKHPLWKTVRPHRGIDYAAPRGTPIMAAGDGRISQASRTKPNGNFVIIQHGEQFVTKYLHLSKFAKGIRSGAKVKQGQVIGYVGATGWVTGPHLHYEFLVNGVHQNPRTVSLPDAQPIADAEMKRFQTQVAPYSRMLDRYKDQIAVAAAQ